MGRICGGALIVLLAIVAVMGYPFLRGEVRQAEDGRTAILLAPAERAVVLSEMRAFLESVQRIVAGITGGDEADAVAAARRAGRIDFDDLPPSLLRKLPLEVKTLGLETHRAFTRLADDMEAGLKGERALARLGEIMLNCTTCHAGYRFDPQPRGQ